MRKTFFGTLFDSKPQEQKLEELVRLPTPGAIFDLTSENMSLFEKELLYLFGIHLQNPEEGVIGPRFIDVYKNQGMSIAGDFSNFFKADPKRVISEFKRYDNNKGFNLGPLSVYLEEKPKFAFLEPVEYRDNSPVRGGLYLSYAKDSRYPFSRREEKIYVVNGDVPSEIKEHIEFRRHLEKEKGRVEAAE